MLKITDLSKSFGGKQVFSGISAEFEKGRIYSITGPSGVGKTTLLRCLTLLETPDSGTITIDGMPLQEKRLSIGLVFQSFNLFPHMIGAAQRQPATGAGAWPQPPRCRRALDAASEPGRSCRQGA